MDSKCYFINGQFWQDDEIPKEVGEKLVLVSRSLEVLFHGLVGSQIAVINEKVVDGYMTDTLGQSVINDLIFSNNSYGTALTFTKQYNHNRSAMVSYRLFRSEGHEIGDDFYAGEWRIGTREITIASGKARCVLTSIPEYFFKKPK